MSAQELDKFLENRGFTPLESDLWSNFIAVSVNTLRQAAESLRDPTRWARFVAKRGALSKPKKTKGKPKQRVPLENGITAELGHCLRQIVRAAPEEHALKTLHIQFETQYQIESQYQTGDSSRRADILAISNLSENSPELCFEAKMLLDEKDIRDSYLSTSGIGCFNDPSAPYTTGPVGAMLGYVILEQQTAWVDRVQFALQGISPVPPSVYFVSIDGEPTSTLCSDLDRSALHLSDMVVLHFAMHFDMQGIS